MTEGGRQMQTAQSVVGFLYYVIVAIIGIEIVSSFWRAEDVETKIMYSVILVPFALRLLRIK